MTNNERKIIELENELREVKSVLNDALEVGRLTQLSYNKLLYASNAKVPSSINYELTKNRDECAVLTRRINQYVDKINSQKT